MLKFATYFSIVFALLISGAKAESIATCQNLSGQAYYVANNLVEKENSGWLEDKITGGEYYLERTTSGYDILYKDSRKKIISSVNDGAKVVLLNRSLNDAIFIVNYGESGVTEVYKFFQDSAGENKMTLSTTRSNIFPVTKISVLLGNCGAINFQAMN